MKRVQVSRAALRDLADIAAFLEPRTSDAATRTLQRITAQFIALAAWPGLGRPREDTAPAFAATGSITF